MGIDLTRVPRKIQTPTKHQIVECNVYKLSYFFHFLTEAGRFCNKVYLPRVSVMLHV